MKKLDIRLSTELFCLEKYGPGIGFHSNGADLANKFVNYLKQYDLLIVNTNNVTLDSPLKKGRMLPQAFSFKTISEFKKELLKTYSHNEILNKIKFISSYRKDDPYLNIADYINNYVFNTLPFVLKTSSEHIEIWRNIKEVTHREDGPAIITVERHSKYIFLIKKTEKEEWRINDNDITFEVEKWIKDNNYPNWKQWDDAIKMHFKLTFL